MATVATFARRRRRANLPPYTPVATALQWIDAAPTLHAFGATANSRAVVVDQRGAVMAGLAPTYSAGNPSAATVNSSTGAVTAVANGTSSITAHSGALTDITQTVTVSQVVASITGVSTTLSTDDASSGTFSPVAKDANGNTVSGASFSYSSAQPPIVSVNASTGAWAGQSAGSTTITITANPGTVQLVVNVTVVHAIGLVISQSPSTVHPGDTVTYTATYNGTDVTADATFTSSDTTVLTIDPPTVGTLSPTSITQGQSNIAFTLSGCTNLRASDVVSGLPTGVTLSSYTVTGGGTGATFNLTASGTATTGSVNLTISNTGHGTSGDVALTVAPPTGAPTVVQSASWVSSTGGGTTITPTLPSAPTQGNLLLAFITHSTQDVTLTNAGWTRKGQATASGPLLDVWYKVAAAGEPSTWTWNSPAADWFGVEVYECHGVNATTPFAAFAATTSSIGNTTTPTTPAVAAGAQNALPLAAIGALAGSSAPWAVTGVSSAAATAGWTKDQSATPSSNAGGAAHRTAAASASDSIACQFSCSANVVSIAGVTLSLNPA